MAASALLASAATLRHQGVTTCHRKLGNRRTDQINSASFVTRSP
jgi:hypothetical protein